MTTGLGQVLVDCGDEAGADVIVLERVRLGGGELHREAVLRHRGHGVGVDAVQLCAGAAQQQEQVRRGAVETLQEVSGAEGPLDHHPRLHGVWQSIAALDRLRGQNDQPLAGGPLPALFGQGAQV